MTRVTLTTANTPGAVAILQLYGGDVASVLQRLTTRTTWEHRRAYLAEFAAIDQGLAILVSERSAQLMPHGGPRVIQRLLDHLIQQLGCAYEPEPDPIDLYPEAGAPIEADTLDAIAKAASPAAIDLLAAQPRIWRSLLQQAGGLDQAQRQAIPTRTQTLNHLLTPPTVVVAGSANVGKSTLANALMGKRMSIVADLPGTTRDWVGGLVELSASNDLQQAIAVNWLDTPGLRDSGDTIEQRAIQLARQQIERADVLIAMRDPSRPWPHANALPRQPDLWVMNKIDDAAEPAQPDGDAPERALQISADHGRNLDRLQAIVIERLGLSDLRDEPWGFSEALRTWCDSGDDCSIADYLG